MAGYIAEFFGYRAEDTSELANTTAARQICPFLNSSCTKLLSDQTISGVCSIRQKTENSPHVICCPIRMYSENYKMLKEISTMAFHCELNHFAGRVAVEKARQQGGAVAIFGHGWGGELRLPQRQGIGSYFIDWVLAKLDGDGQLTEFTAIEVQTIDTTGNYRSARTALLDNRHQIDDTVGLNWENVSKRIIPQIIYKGQILQREDLCKTGLFFVCPKPVYNKIINRLGGKERVPTFPAQPASIHFISYDYIFDCIVQNGQIRPLGIVEEHCTTVYKVQEAFSSVNLPDGNVYRDAIRRSLYGSV